MAHAEDVFAQTPLELDGNTEEEVDAALGALIHLYLRSAFDHGASCWPGRDEHDTLRRTCHAVEVLYRLDFETDAVAMAREAGNWLINLPIRDRLLHTERERARLYPSRFKTLAYVQRFDDEEVRRDFDDLLAQEVAGVIRGVTESDVLTTCIVLDTLITLERSAVPLRQEVCSDERYFAIIAALRGQLKHWRSANAVQRGRRSGPLASEGGLTGSRRTTSLSEINNPRDLSYVLGLLLSVDQESLSTRQTAAVTADLADAIENRDQKRTDDLSPALYSALQLAEHYRDDEMVQHAIAELLREVRNVYSMPDVSRRLDLSHHTQVLRLLLTYHGEGPLTRAIVARLLRGEERRRAAPRNTLETELASVIRERIKIEIGTISELSGGFTTDHIFRVPFSYWYPAPGYDGEHSPVMGGGLHEPSVIIKRSTSDAFHTATENYRQLPPAVRRYFVRYPAESQVYKSGLSPAYYLTMEDLANLYTLEYVVNECDQRAMSPNHLRSLHGAVNLASDAVFALFRETYRSGSGFPGTQIARLYLSGIEGKLARATTGVPWLKNPLQGYYVGEQRFRGLDYYLAVVGKYSHVLQPHSLGLTHGDLHARNIMLDLDCTELKLIDLDKLSWNGDYVGDLGNLLTDVCVYRRVAQPERDFGLPRSQIQFITKAEVGTAENTVRYPALGRPATLAFQQAMLARIEQFADQIQDKSWRPRLWLASSAALFARIVFHSEKEVAAVLYGEAIRLMHELCRFLEHNQELPELLVPSAWPITSSGYPVGDLPDWVTNSGVLRAIHSGLSALGLRHEFTHASITYYSARQTATGNESPVLLLVPPRREGIARMLLPSSGHEWPSTSLKIAHSTQAGDAFGTIVILNESTNANEALDLVRAGLDGAVA
ncbi:MAG: hypothetical protein ACLQUY_13120 [Ktedonobacterales bacterium]